MLADAGVALGDFQQFSMDKTKQPRSGDLCFCASLLRVWNASYQF